MEALLWSRWVLGVERAGRFASLPSDGPPEHQSPGYGAGYDDGFQAGLLAASQGRESPPVPLPPAAASQGGAGAGAPESARPPLLALIEDFPDLLQRKVLERLDRIDLALLGRTGSAVRTAVVSSGLSRYGGSAEEPRVAIAQFGQSLSTFVWAVANGCPWQLATTCQTLAGYGHLEVLQWARNHGCGWDECARAAAGGHLEVLRWAREHGCPWQEEEEDHQEKNVMRTRNCCARAAQGGHLEVLKWLREHHCPWDEWTCARAAEGGHLDVLKWARQHGCPWEEDIEGSERDCCAQAAQGGHTEVLKWAREHHCPWDKSTCAYAARGGQVEVLRWAREHHCPWNEDNVCCHDAAGNAQLEVLKWAREHGCPWDEVTCECAAWAGHLEVLNWTREHDCPWDTGTCASRRRGRSPGGVAVGAGAELPVGCGKCKRRRGRSPGGVKMGAGAPLPMGSAYVRERGVQRAPGYVEVGNAARVSGRRAVSIPFVMNAQPPPCRLRVKPRGLLVEKLETSTWKGIVALFARAVCPLSSRRSFYIIKASPIVLNVPRYCQAIASLLLPIASLPLHIAMPGVV